MPSVARLRGEIRDGLKSAIGPALKLTGQHLATKTETEQLLHDRAEAVGDAVKVLRVGDHDVHDLEVLRSGLLRVDRRTILDPDYGNRAAVFSVGAPSETVDHAALVWSHLWSNFYHWVVDVLPKLCALQEAFGPTLDGRRLCYPSFGGPYEREYLNLLGIPATQVVDTRDHRKIRVTGDVAVMTLPGWGQVHPAATAVRDRLGGRGVGSAGDRIYMSRTGRRSVTNDAAVADALGRFGFARVDDDARPIVEQIGIFANASVIVGAHGAALSNLIWCRPGTVVIELLPAAYQPRYFQSLCEAMGLIHHAVVEDGAVDDGGHWTSLSDDQTVNVDRLTALVASIVGP